MMTFATIDDYEERFGSVENTDMLQACLEDATDVMCSELDASGIEYSEPSESFAYRLMRVCRTMVHRAIGEDDNDPDEESGPPPIPYGATQFSQTAGPYTRSATIGNPYGDLFVTEAERRSLGIGVPKASIISPYC